MLAFIVIYAVCELFAALIAAQLPYSRSVWARSDEQRQFSLADFSIHISNFTLFWKYTSLCIYHVLSSHAEKASIICRLLRNIILQLPISS